jgi:PPOX class probable F420-dependent enzyme
MRTMAAPTSALEPLVREKAVLFTAYHRNGTPVRTPLHVAVDGCGAFVRAWDTSGKAKRIRDNPEIEVAPSTASFTP